MLYCSWDMVHDGCKCFSFWVILCPYNPLTAQKVKIKKRMKIMPGGIIILYKRNKNYDQMMYGSWDMVRNGRTHRLTDEKSDVERWVPHLKIIFPTIKLTRHLFTLLCLWQQIKTHRSNQLSHFWIPIKFRTACNIINTDSKTTAEIIRPCCKLWWFHKLQLLKDQKASKKWRWKLEYSASKEFLKDFTCNILKTRFLQKHVELALS